MSFDQSDHPAFNQNSCPDLHSWGMLTLEVSCQRQNQRNAALVQLAVHVDPCRHQHYRFCSVATRSVQYCIDILSGIRVSRSLILVLLPGSPQSCGLE